MISCNLFLISLCLILKFCHSTIHPCICPSIHNAYLSGLWQLIVASWLNPHVFGLWVETGALGGNPHRPRESMQTPLQLPIHLLLCFREVRKLENHGKPMWQEENRRNFTQSSPSSRSNCRPWRLWIGAVRLQQLQHHAAHYRNFYTKYPFSLF